LIFKEDGQGQLKIKLLPIAVAYHSRQPCQT
jgi:hypothetical protein